MMARIIFTVIILFLTGCGGEDKDSSSDNDTSKPAVPTNPNGPPPRDTNSEINEKPVALSSIPISGEWKYQYDENCYEITEFNSDGTFKLTMPSLTVNGTYKISQVTDQHDLYKLYLTYTSSQPSDTCADYNVDESDFPVNSTDSEYIRTFGDSIAYYYHPDFDNSEWEYVRSNQQPSNPDSPTTPDSPANASDFEAIHDIVWLEQHQNTLCFDGVGFSNNNQFISGSIMQDNLSGTMEILSGTYTVNEHLENGRFATEITITEDNGLPNCDGFSEDDTGSFFIYIEKSPEQIHFYESANATEPFASYDYYNKIEI